MQRATMSQQSLFAPGSANREEPIQVRLLARATDPATSKQGAQRVVESGRLTSSQEGCLAIVRGTGPGTAKQLVARWKPVHPTQVYHELCRRLPELERKGLVRVQRDAKGVRW